MASTPTPVTVPAIAVLNLLAFPWPTTIRPIPTVTTDSPRLTMVSTGSYRTGLSGTSKPSIAVKCISQMAPPPIANAAIINQRLRLPRVRASRARPVLSRPRNDPRKASRNAATGLKAQYVKWWIWATVSAPRENARRIRDRIVRGTFSHDSLSTYRTSCPSAGTVWQRGSGVDEPGVHLVGEQLVHVVRLLDHRMGDVAHRHPAGGAA